MARLYLRILLCTLKKQKPATATGEANLRFTLYVARHTYTTTLKRKGASTGFIKESLGHQTILTTENYLDSFEDKERVKWANALLD